MSKFGIVRIRILGGFGTSKRMGAIGVEGWHLRPSLTPRSNYTPSEPHVGASENGGPW